ncbi:MAG: hypothetical protein P8Q42_10300 [Flavobacteriales bacterium]|nr:hypothetical protein [Flavobacteriales bacterium]
MSNKKIRLNFETELLTQYSTLKKREIDLSITGMSSRVFNYCKNKGIIDFSNETEDGKRKKVKLNYFEAYWILIINELRLFGLSDKTLINIKNYLHENIWDYVENNKEDLNTIKDLLEKHFDFGVDIELEIEKYLPEIIKELKKVPDSDRIFLTFLGSSMGTLILSNDSPSLVFKANLDPKTKDQMPIIGMYESQLTEIDASELDLSDACIKIPLRPLYEKLFDWDIKDETFQSYRLITDREKEILDIIRTGDFKELTITPSKLEPIIKLKSSGSIKGDKVKEIRKLLGLKEYESINLKFRNNKDIYFENTSKK